jgi:lysophospholipase L1-like esterase
MKKIALIGDSIRMGYQAMVIEQLAGSAEILSPEQNGGDSRRVLAHVDEWVTSLRPDIVHLNCGLHDLKREFATPEGTQVPLAEYRQNLEAIFRRITEDTGAVLIWAATTPVNEERHHAVKGFDRFEADVHAFNAAALEIARQFSRPVDDLYAAVMQAGRDELLGGDGVHFTPQGYRLLGTAVADFLRVYI